MLFAPIIRAGGSSGPFRPPPAPLSQAPLPLLRPQSAPPSQAHQSGRFFFGGRFVKRS